MKKVETTNECCNHEVFKKHHHSRGGSSNPIYGLGVIGALFYYLQSATSFWMVVAGIFKSIFWPAVLMFEMMSYFHL